MRTERQIRTHLSFQVLEKEILYNILFEIDIQVSASRDSRQRPPAIRRRLTRLRLTSRTTSVGSKCMSRTGQQFFK